MRFPEARLGSVTKIVNGGTPDTKIPAYWNGGIAWLTPKDMGRSPSPYSRATGRTISEAGLNDCSARLVPPSSVILSTRAPIGHLAINQVEMAFNQGCRALVPSEKLDTKFLYYFLQANIGLLNDLGTGTTFKELSAGALANVQMPLPPRAEQQRIVAILDEAFEGISTAAELAQANLAQARSLLNATIRYVLEQADPSWTDTKIGDQVTLQRGVDITKAAQRPGTVPVVSSGGIRSHHSEALVKAPGVVMGRKGTLGKVFYLEQDFWPHDTSLYVRDFKGNDPLFVYYFFKVLDVSGLDSGAANPALNRNVVHALPVCWPPLELQKAIVSKLDGLSDHGDALVGLYERKLAALAELKQSLLTRAFSGELTREPLAA